METFNNSSANEEDYYSELTNFERKCFTGPPPERFADVRELELNQLVEQRHSALRDGSKNSKLVCINLS